MDIKTSRSNRKPKKGQDPLGVQSRKDKPGISEQGHDIRNSKPSKSSFAPAALGLIRRIASKAKAKQIKAQPAPNFPDEPGYKPKQQSNPYTSSQLGRIKKEAK